MILKLCIRIKLTTETLPVDTVLICRVLENVKNFCDYKPLQMRCPVC